MLPVVLYECKTCFEKLREEHRSRVFGNMCWERYLARKGTR